MYAIGVSSWEDMIFFETSVFTSQIVSLLDDESYAEFQQVLVADPEAGNLIPRSGGLRKIRWKLAGSGKSGGIRVIYYLVCAKEIFLLFAYTKGKQENLTEDQVRKLRNLVGNYLSHE